MKPDTPPDYLLIGHVAHDVTPHGPMLGGTVSYAAHTAAAFGIHVGIITSTAANEPVLVDLPPGVSIINVPAPHSTTFDNRYTPTGRIQFMYHRATPLDPDAVPPAWREARLIHLAPIAYEVAPELVTLFGEHRICATPQGWMRQREQDSRVREVDWPDATRVLPATHLTVISEEDIRHNPGLEAEFAQLAPLLVVTRGPQGGTFYQNGQRSTFTTPTVEQVDPTGAGDIFATALHIALDRLGDIERALTIAAELASRSVTRRGFASAPTRDEVDHAWRAHTNEGFK